jgi:hypothetical protein
MKNKMLLGALIAALMVTTLGSQGAPITPASSGSTKVKLTGNLQFIDVRPAGRLLVDLTLTYAGNPVVAAKAWLNDQLLVNDGNGRYRGSIDPYNGRIGNKVELSVELTPAFMSPGSTLPFSGRRVLVTIPIENLIEWIFPAYDDGQVIILADYSSGGIPFRWDFLAAPVALWLHVWEEISPGVTRMVHKVLISSESALVPVKIFSPGKGYSAGIQGQIGRASLSKLLDAGSAFLYTYSAGPGRFRVRTLR